MGTEIDPLEIKSESSEYDVVDVFQSCSDNEVYGENQAYERDPLDLIVQESKIIGNGCHRFVANGVKNGNPENGDCSSEPTLISVSNSAT